MKTKNRILSVLIALACVFSSCQQADELNYEINAFRNGTSSRNMIVVVSDMHLGADLSYSECKYNLPSLVEFLKQVKASPNVKELVIAGDLLDEWFVPAPVDTYEGKGQVDFVQRIAIANKAVFDELNSIIKEKLIKVTYVPGNHDLTITEQSVERILPGINQARDPELGLGTYSPAGFPKLVIEHGHRYNFFCAPDPFSNQEIAPGTIVPPGYFFTRIAALYVSLGYPKTGGDVIPVVTHTASGNESQDMLFEYWKIWNWALHAFTINRKFNDDIIVTNIDGFTGALSVNDVLPYQTTPGGAIDVNLYNGIQDNWSKRQVRNRVPVNIPVKQAISGSASAGELDSQSKTLYLLNPESDARIVVFGHTHVPMIEASENHLGQKSIYANTGTWIDHNTLSSNNMTFLVITPQSDKASSQTFVKLYSFEKDEDTEIAVDSLRL